AHSALAAVLLEQGDAEGALEAAQAAIELEPDNPRGYRLIYEAQTRLGNEREAEQAMASLRGLARGTDLAALLFNEGAAALREGDVAAAESRFEEALAEQPDLAQAQEGLMLVYARQGRWQEAAAKAEQVLATDPGDKRALRVRYDSYTELGDEARSREAFDALAAVDPARLAETFFDSGVAKFNAGDTAGAAADLERVVALTPDNSAAHYNLALSYTNMGSSAKAKEHFEAFLRLAPDDPNAATAREMMQYLE
ncbi:MAG: tetratricopeptide repeat protein, partial [Thermoanaerobaculia bacterium]|nr:tetratricopeptide repeat protein [Thermoanaerobaculia bacterium]